MAFCVTIVAVTYAHESGSSVRWSGQEFLLSFAKCVWESGGRQFTLEDCGSVRNPSVFWLLGQERPNDHVEVIVGTDLVANNQQV